MRKGIQLELEMEKERQIRFLDVEFIRKAQDQCVNTRWYQKECNAGMCCNRRIDMDEGTKKNLIHNMERKVERLTSAVEQKEELKEKI